ncbi:hypothetical protein B5V89_09035 [Heyndrickxia sporothermodurans]|uniref:polysaccharide deacetylase family protein n=1 Tax=Heyndrickxia TaxID=2837504 RepID=UPI000D37FE0D|nr:polysaccharide deacetylase family protein [Heyndrickxia sporothermodurans]PTY78876.1 hypothetical protein B5V89_09035 [Heyndrickxia sporothermodurans]
MTNKQNQRRKRMIYEIGAIIIILLFIVGFSFRGTEDDVMVAVKKQGPPNEIPMMENAPQLKQTMKGSIYATSIIQKEKELIQQEENQKIVYLTFDDGPSSDANELLDVLDHYGAKATFFMLAPHIKAYPEVVKRMVKTGYAVGLHGVTHDARQFYHSKKSPLHEMQEDQKVLEKITGVRSTLIRTPYGSVPYMLDSYRKEIESYGFQLWDWDIDSDDWKSNSKAYVSRVINGIKFMDSIGKHPVILLHDRGPTIKYLPILLNWLNKNHFVTKNLEESMDAYSFKCNDRCHPYGS